MAATPLTPDLFPDAPVPLRRVRVGVPYRHGNPALRTAQYFARAMVESKDALRKSECHRNMVAALLAKDGLA